ncbi:hypothetical protein [Bradyrhizobium sp.]|jgi:hypothetical protein|uniref:hypothetical protein n=1 Tax=Bradyrhizobium sp. TaxID=376 RepID=UPI003C17CA86
MADNRAAILTGAKAAHTLHRDLGIKEQIERAGGGRVDVFGAIDKLGATLMFQPLDKLPCWRFSRTAFATLIVFFCRRSDDADGRDEARP